MLDVLRKLWAGGWVEHHGEFFDFAPLEMSPAPPGPVPVYVGGLSDVAIRRAARHDGWISDLHSAAELADYRRRLDDARAAAGRADEPFVMIASCNDVGDYDGYRRLEEIGVTHLLTLPWIFTHGFTDDLDARVAGMEAFAESVLSRFV